MLFPFIIISFITIFQFLISLNSLNKFLFYQKSLKPFDTIIFIILNYSLFISLWIDPNCWIIIRLFAGNLIVLTVNHSKLDRLLIFSYDIVPNPFYEVSHFNAQIALMMIKHHHANLIFVVYEIKKIITDQLFQVNRSLNLGNIIID